MNKEILKEIIVQQSEMASKKKFTHRELLDNYTDHSFVNVLSGIRRCGKSTLMNIIRAQRKEKDYYLNFDDERLLSFNVSDFQMLCEVFTELFGKQNSYYFDEIQNINKWERFIRRLYDNGNEIFITGSNARLLSYELGTHLTGRYIQVELFPFSFKEFVQHKGVKLDNKLIYNTKRKAEIVNLFEDYFKHGGFPEFFETKNKLYLKSLYDSLLYKDVLVRNRINKEREVKELVFRLASDLTKPVSYTKLAQTIGVKNSQTVKQYLDFLENTYLIFQVNKFDYSATKQVRNQKKIYFIDNALVNELGFQFSEDRGRYLENLVFLELKRRTYEIFYHREKKECDFICRKGAKIEQAIQVTSKMYDPRTKLREFDGLYEAMNSYNLNTGLLLTESDDFEEEYKGKLIKVKPIWKWLLDL
jgi:predicted AAA+ superfamily ATPase